VTRTLDIDLTNPQLYENGFPHDVFTELRGRAPVHLHPAIEGRPDIPSIPFWAIVAHPEIQQANRDWKTFAAQDGPLLGPDPLMSAGRTLLTLDPPDQTEMRRIISSEFTPRMVGTLEQRLTDRTTRILEAAADGTCDFVRDIAYQVPMHVIADIIGIPEDDRSWVLERTDRLLKMGDPYRADFSADKRLGLQAELFEYAQRITADKRANPADDVWTKLAARLDGFELEMFFLILSLAGSETTRNALSMGLIALLEHPDQLAEPRSLANCCRRGLALVEPGAVLRAHCHQRRDHRRTGCRRATAWCFGTRRETATRTFLPTLSGSTSTDPQPARRLWRRRRALLPRRQSRPQGNSSGVRVDCAGYDIEPAGPAVWTGAGPVHNVGIGIDSLPMRIRPRR
jgi:cytochrome P450